MTQGLEITPGVPPRNLPRESRSRGSSDWSRTAAGLLTSDLSVNEFSLVSEAGSDPGGLVVGSSILHVGFQPGYGLYQQG